MGRIVNVLGKPTMIYSMREVLRFLDMVNRIRAAEKDGYHKEFIEYGYTHIYDKDADLTYMIGGPGVEQELVKV